ncbi:MAG TPA: cytochrome c [Tepidisphaeraceae bacterium]|nr:cytochrome c [Tepidisphaeraceae bacterium]
MNHHRPPNCFTPGQSTRALAEAPPGIRSFAQRWILSIVFLGPVAAVLAGCAAAARREEPLVGEFTSTDPHVIEGQRVFMARCHQCHPGGRAGLGPGINDKPLPGPLIKLQVRKGLGAMPAFDEARISDAQLDRLVKYLAALK